MCLGVAQGVAADILLMYGGKSESGWVDTAMERLAQIFPHAETTEFPAPDHFGIDTEAPRDVAAPAGVYSVKPAP